MIAEISPSFGFSSFLKKVEYHENKIENGVARVITSAVGDEDLRKFSLDAELVAGMNTRVKDKYIEFNLNLVPGEHLVDEQYKDLINEYLQDMGYSDTVYSAVLHTDKAHEHVHILCTRIDMEGKGISDSFSHLKSQALSRHLEKKYGLRETVYNKFDNQRLSEIRSREYFFHKGLIKGLKSYTSKSELMPLLEGIFDKINIEKPRTNLEWEVILGNERYNEVGEVLERKKHFNHQFKDELLKVLDDNICGTKTFSEFQKKVQDRGYYMRMVSKNGINSFVYGIPSAGFYVKEKDLPRTFRYENLKGKGFSLGTMTEDYQKSYLYNVVFRCLNQSKSMDEFKESLAGNRVGVVEHSNSGGTYGFSFYVSGLDSAEVFKASEISRKLSYWNINNFFNDRENEAVIKDMVGNREILCTMEENLQFFETGIPSMVLDEPYDEPVSVRKRRKKGRSAGNNERSITD